MSVNEGFDSFCSIRSGLQAALKGWKTSDLSGATVWMNPALMKIDHGPITVPFSWAYNDQWKLRIFGFLSIFGTQYFFRPFRTFNQLCTCDQLRLFGPLRILRLLRTFDLLRRDSPLHTFNLLTIHCALSNCFALPFLKLRKFNPPRTLRLRRHETLFVRSKQSVNCANLAKCVH